MNKPTLPPFEEFMKVCETIWNSGYVTNFGNTHSMFLEALKKRFLINNLALSNNATTALMGMIRLLAINDREHVITSPFTFVATAHAIKWAGKTPKFVDVGAGSFNITPETVEPAIDRNTALIMPVHCYGMPCDTVGFAKLSEKTGIPVVYDAAHAFGVMVNEKPLLKAGDASVISTHATKAFNSIEGAIVYAQHTSTIRKFTELTNFGISQGSEVASYGFNGKLSELHAAVGLLNLENYDNSIADRQKLWNAYNDAFEGLEGVKTPKIQPAVKHNFGYYPLVLDKKQFSIDTTIASLANDHIKTRKYFSPLLTSMACFESTPVFGDITSAKTLENTVLCLPIHEDYLATADQIICSVFNALNAGALD